MNTPDQDKQFLPPGAICDRCDKIKPDTPGVLELMDRLKIRGKARLCRCAPVEEARPRYAE